MQVFGTTISLSTCSRDGRTEADHNPDNLMTAIVCVTFQPKQIPVRWIGEQHVQEDLGHIPTAADWLRRLSAEPWMNRSRKLSRELAES